MTVRWSSVGEKKPLQRVDGRLGVDALGSGERCQSVVEVTSSEEWDHRPCLSRTVVICAWCSGIIIFIEPLFTCSQSRLEDTLEHQPRAKQQRLKNKRGSPNQENNPTMPHLHILLKNLKHAVPESVLWDPIEQ